MGLDGSAVGRRGLVGGWAARGIGMVTRVAKDKKPKTTILSLFGPGVLCVKFNFLILGFCRGNLLNFGIPAKFE